MVSSDVAPRTSARSYGGMSAADRVAERRVRLVAAALELIGTRGLAAATIRGVADASGLAARYVYESFRTVEDLQMAVFDAIAQEAAERSIAALVQAPPGADAEATRTRTQMVLAAMVDLMLDDPRKGRVVLVEAVSSPVLGPRVREESRRFAQMLAATANAGDPFAQEELPLRVKLVAQFLIGGVGQTFAAVLDGDIEIARGDLVDLLLEIFTSLLAPITR